MLFIVRKWKEREKSVSESLPYFILLVFYTFEEKKCFAEVFDAVNY
jgi:hypothetical protein